MKTLITMKPLIMLAAITQTVNFCVIVNGLTNSLKNGEKTMADERPPINWFGGVLVTRQLLHETVGDPEAIDDKMNRGNFLQRVLFVTRVLNSLGPTLEAAQMLQADGKGFFTGVSADALATKLEESVESLRKGGVWKFRAAESGTLNFEKTQASPPGE